MLLDRQKLAPFIAELIGTFVLAFGVLSISKSAIGIPYFVAIGAGIVLTVLVLVIGRVSGPHYNPAVTLGFWVARKITFAKGLGYAVAQFMGGAFAWKLYTYLIDTTIPNIASKEFDWRVFTAEAVGTLVFTFGIAAAVYQKYEGGKFAATIGGSLVVGVLIATVLSNGMLNPAVALGAQSWSREYVLAPLLGGVVGINLYALLFSDEGLARLPIAKRASAPSKITFSSKTKKVAAKKTTKRR